MAELNSSNRINYSHSMRRYVIFLCLLMLALRGMAGVSMQTTMGVKQIKFHQVAMASYAASGNLDTLNHEPCHGCCEGCNVCDVCHLLSAQPPEVGIDLRELSFVTPQAQIKPLASADPRTAPKPPLLLS